MTTQTPVDPGPLCEFYVALGKYFAGYRSYLPCPEDDLKYDYEWNGVGYSQVTKRGSA